MSIYNKYRLYRNIIVCLLLTVLISSCGHNYKDFWRKADEFRKSCYDIVAPIYEEEDVWVNMTYLASDEAQEKIDVVIETFYMIRDEYGEFPKGLQSDTEGVVYVELNWMGQTVNSLLFFREIVDTFSESEYSDDTAIDKLYVWTMLESIKYGVRYYHENYEG